MKVNENRFFKEVTVRICGSLDIDQALTQLFDFVGRFMPVDAMFLSYVDLENRVVKPVARAVRDEINPMLETDVTKERPLDSAEFEILRDIQENWETTTIIRNPADHDPTVVKNRPELKLFSLIRVHLTFRKKVVGQFTVCALGENRYTHEHADLLTSVREPIAIAMSNARRYLELAKMKDTLVEDKRALNDDLKRVSGMEVVGADFGLRHVMEQVRQVAPSSSPVLLLGETGTGKEVLANAIHMTSTRQQGPMITMQCGATPDTLLDSELFGHEKGAFTGASSLKRGRFERADGGTLFLDEIGELSLEAQVKLLRILQEKCFERVGGTETIKVDVRVIAATHRDLDKMVRDGTFREDLWYRLNVLPIRIPPLRLRREDIPSLVQYFIERKGREMTLLRTPRVGSDAMKLLTQYDWPGNVRELQNIVERSLILTRGDRLIVPDLGGEPPKPSNKALEPATHSLLALDQVISRHICSVLDKVGGQVAGKGGAAELLHVHPNTLRYKMKKLGIQCRTRHFTQK